MTLFCDTPCDSNPAGPIQEAVRHGFLQSLESVSQLVQPSQTDRPVQAPRVKLPAISFPPALSSAALQDPAALFYVAAILARVLMAPIRPSLN
jgi:hypothetical protein